MGLVFKEWPFIALLRILMVLSYQEITSTLESQIQLKEVVHHYWHFMIHSIWLM